jgi:hypothetical protein
VRVGVSRKATLEKLEFDNQIPTSSTRSWNFRSIFSDRTEHHIHVISESETPNHSTARYKSFVVFAVAMIFVYPVGTPLLYYAMLWKHRGTLRDPDAMSLHEVRMALLGLLFTLNFQTSL